MGLIDGDEFVSGDILSFQQGNRLKDNWIQADPQTNLSNPQDGMTVVDSDDDKFYLYSGSAYEEILQLTRSADVDPSFNDIQIAKSVLRENLLSNSGFGPWSQGDVSKGLATITYDTGAKGAGSAPGVGDAIVGANGGTCKLISYTTASGTWAGGDAAGVLTVGAISHDFAFVDNEVLTFGGVETAAVNMADSAVQVGLLQNGGFAAATTGWLGADCTLASIAGGKVGNCLEITRTGGTDQRAWFQLSLTIGKIYKFSAYVKSGTSGNEAFALQIRSNGTIYATTTGTSSAAWVLYSVTWEATVTAPYLVLQKNSATAGTMLFDEVTCYEITPCCTAADTIAMDRWIKDSTVDIYREHSGANVQDGSFYANKLVVTAAADYVRFPGAIFDNEEWYMQFQGRTVTFGKYIKTSTASHAKLTITDSAGSTSSSFHTGGGTYEWLEVTRIINAGATSVAFYVYGDIAPNVDGSTIIYHCQGMLVFGSYIGEGNYKPIPQEVIRLEKKIPSNLLDGKTNKSDVAVADLNIEADSDAMLPKGCKAVKILTQCNDAGSAGTDCYLRFRANATKDYEYYNSPYGLVNDMDGRVLDWQMCDEDGDIDYNLEASGANTFDIDQMDYVAIQLN